MDRDRILSLQNLIDISRHHLKDISDDSCEADRRIKTLYIFREYELYKNLRVTFCDWYDKYGYKKNRKYRFSIRQQKRLQVQTCSLYI